MTPLRAAEPYDWAALHALIAGAFEAMAGRIDPPSSVHRLTPGALARQAAEGEVWVVEDDARPVATVTATPRADCLYLGKLAVAPSHRGQGLARALVEAAAASARARGLPSLVVQHRVELAENHAVFSRLGFEAVGTEAHAGYDRPTSVVMRRALEGAA